MDYEKKVSSAIKLLQSIPQDGPIEVCYSTGKDSDVILELAKMAGIPFVAIYKNTTCDYPGSIQHAREMGAEIRNPEKNFLRIIEEKGWPSRWTRFCCSVLKEYKIHDRAIVGVRRSESTNRAKRYHEPEICRVYNKKEKSRQYLPLLEWTDADVERFIKERGLKCHPHYYDADGKFHVERRVGCIGCPMQSDNGRSAYKEFPMVLRARVRAFKKWWDSHPDSKTRVYFDNIYDALYMKLFCKNLAEFNTAITPPLFSEYQLDTKKYLEEYFGIDLTV